MKYYQYYTLSYQNGALILIEHTILLSSVLS
nr:MAG TPA: hypothetical protein [Bacteriophage sp.]